jgi:molybdate transport system substrate-binding protein
MVYRFRAVLLLVAVFSGCSVPGPEDNVKGWRIRVAAASDLQTVLPKLIERFKSESPNDTVEPIFGASGQLATQIEAGAPFDLFLSANEKYVRTLESKGLVKRPIATYAIGKLVLAVNQHSVPGALVSRLEDIARPEIKKIAIANPEVAPYGAAAVQVLKRAGLWEKVEPKVVRADTVRQALQFVETGNAEVGLVSKATADVPGVRLVDVDPTLHDPIVQSLGVLRIQGDNDLVDRFAKFLLGDAGRSILEAHGFTLPSQAAP